MIKRVAPGQPFKPRAEDWNAFVDAAEAHRSNVRTGAAESSVPLQAGEVLVRTTLGVEYEQYSLLTPAHTAYNLVVDPAHPDTVLNQFLHTSPIVNGGFGGSLLTGGTPNSFVLVLQEPITAAHPVARAKYSGLTPCQVEITDFNHHFAEIIPGDCTKLRSAAGGSIRIVAGHADTGLHWCLVCLGDSAPVTAMATVGYDTGQAIELPYHVGSDPSDTYHWMAYTAAILPGMTAAHSSAYAAMLPIYEATVLVPGRKALYGTVNDTIAGLPVASTPLPVQWSSMLGSWVGSWTSPIVLTGHNKISVAAYQVGVGAAGMSPHYIGASESETLYIAMNAAVHWPPVSSGPRLVTNTAGYTWFLPVGEYVTDADANCTSLVSYFTSPPILPFNAGFTGSRLAREMGDDGYEYTAEHIYVNGALTGAL